jgi:hypothetical protein
LIFAEVVAPAGDASRWVNNEDNKYQKPILNFMLKNNVTSNVDTTNPAQPRRKAER